MDPVTEYYQRNAVQTPLIRYAPSGNLIVRRTSTCRIENKYEVMTISFTNKDGTPGSFRFLFYMPTHNGYKSNRAALTCTDDKNVVWDEYEEYAKLLANNYKGKAHAVLDQDELRLACWEIFLYSYDSVLAEFPLPFLELVYATMDYNLAPKERLVKVNDVVDAFKNCADPQLASHLKLVNQGWSSCQHYMDLYSGWLGNLINN